MLRFTVFPCPHFYDIDSHLNVEELKVIANFVFSLIKSHIVSPSLIKMQQKYVSLVANFHIC